MGAAEEGGPAEELSPGPTRDLCVLPLPSSCCFHSASWGSGSRMRLLRWCKSGCSFGACWRFLRGVKSTGKKGQPARLVWLRGWSVSAGTKGLGFDCWTRAGVSSAVAVGKEPVLSRRENENGCVLETLHCAGCALSLGYIYRCTPDHLDYKRDLFCLKVEATESYVLGSSEKQIVSEDKELFNLESRVEIENSLKQMEDVLKVLQTKLQDMETKLSSSSHAETSCESPV
ncbi:protein Mis18-alpha isoform 2-T2 [Molossus nigricans]